MIVTLCQPKFSPPMRKKLKASTQRDQTLMENDGKAREGTMSVRMANVDE